MTWACHHPEHTSLDCVSDSHMADNGGTKGELAMLSQSSHFKVSPKPPGEKNKEPGGGENWGAGFQSDCAWDWQPLRRKQRRKESRRKGLASIPPPPPANPGASAQSRWAGIWACFHRPPVPCTGSHSAVAHSLGISWGTCTNISFPDCKMRVNMSMIQRDQGCLRASACLGFVTP